MMNLGRFDESPSPFHDRGLPFASFPCMAQSPTDAAGPLGNQALGKYGSKGGLERKPLQAPHVGSTPFEHPRRFDSRQRPASLSVFAALHGDPRCSPVASGDIATLMVSQDTDFDGVLDYSYQAPFPRVRRLRERRHSL